jgi:hypothetical protein
VSLLENLAAAGIGLELDKGRVVARGPLTPKQRVQISLHEQALAREIEARDARYRAEVLASNRGVLTHLARAEGFDEETIRRAVDWLGAMRSNGTFKVTKDRITIQLHGDVTAVFKHPRWSCRHYWPEERGRRCVDYRGDGECARPEYEKCVEWVKANSR